MTLTSADGKNTAEQKVELGESGPIRDWPEGDTRRLGDFGYLRIAEMNSGQKFIRTLDEAMLNFRETHGIIIDVRGNGGGTQDAIRTLMPYFMEPDAAMKVINIAAYRLPLVLPYPNPSGFLGLDGRGLHPLSSSVWKPAERMAIERFMQAWKPKWELPAGQFSDWHFMGITPSTNPNAYPYRRPVVVLQNAGCFSATDNFLGALKGHPRVTLLGTASGGGSGRMASYELPHARASFTLCQMASFATTGQTYDGYGVAPDVVLDAKPADYLVGGKDSQLEAAIDLLTQAR
jgi:C-terminal processing protease CtpA/Prc